MNLVCCGRRRSGSIVVDEDGKELDGVERFRRFWDEKLKEVAELIAGKTELELTSTFHITLQLYAHKDVVDKLFLCYEEHPEEVEFYIPQLCTFLLHGQYFKYFQLEVFLLAQCGRSLQFAHRLHWFLVSFCTNGITYISEGLSATVDKPSAENGQLMNEIARQGGVPATLLSLGLQEGEIDTEEKRASRIAAQVAAQANLASPEQITLFQTTPRFFKALTDLADRLIPLPLVDRKSNLRAGLAEIVATFFPSMTIYLPLGNAVHRVQNMIIDECFPFSTKERVPYLICVEVVDYDLSVISQPRAQSSSNSNRVSYTMKLPFNKRVTVAMSSSVGDDILATSTVEQQKSNENGDKIQREETPPSATGDATPLAYKYPMTTVPTCPQEEDDATTKTFVVESFNKSFTVSFRNEENDDENDTAIDKDDDDAKTKTMGQWANRKRTSHKKYGKRMVELKKDSSDDIPLRDTFTEENNALSPSVWSDTGERVFQEEDEATDHEDNQHGKPVIAFRERWSEKEARLRSQSKHGNQPGWRLVPVIIKSNDDLRQEQFAAQLIAQCHKIFVEGHLPLSLRPYTVIATSATCGLIEAVPDTVSLDSLKKNDPDYTTLLDFYQRYFGHQDGTRFKRARKNFVESLAAYSIVCYIFQIKDRHNGNILVDADGHVIHIDFGFLFTNSPGGNIGFESAPFKLTDEFVQLLDGPRSALFRHFRSLCVKAYWALHQNMDKLLLLVEMMLVNDQPELRLPCFTRGKKATMDELRERLNPGLGKIACQEFVNELIDQSLNSWRTRWYDKYQYCCMGIL